jgi:hypothetical protein
MMRMKRLIQPISGLRLAAAGLAVLTMLGTPAIAQDDAPPRGPREGDRRPGDRRAGENRPEPPGGRGQGRWNADQRARRGGGGPGMWGSIGYIMQPEFVSRDASFITTELKLDREQQSILEMLLLDYQESFQLAMDEAREGFEAFREQRQQDPERQLRDQQRDELREKFRAMREKMRSLRENTPEGKEIDPEQLEKFQAEMGQLQDQMRELRPQMPQGEEMMEIYEQLAPIGRNLRNTRHALGMQFRSDLLAILNDQQTEHWDRFNRALLRMKTMNRGQLSGESIDLLNLLAQMDLSEDQLYAMETLVEGYDLQMDAALKARNAVLDEDRTEFMEAMSVEDIERTLAFMRKEAERRIAVRNVNDEYAPLFASGLVELGEDDTADEFMDRYHTEAYPFVFRPSFTLRAIDAAMMIDGLDEDMLTAIQDLRENYMNETAPMNDSLLRVVREQEPKRQEQFMRMRMEQVDPREMRNMEDPIRESMGSRREVDDRYYEQLSALLGPELAEQLPQRRRGPGGQDRNFQRGRGGDRDVESREARRAELIERFDKDGDGQLNEEERRAAGEAMRQERENRN